MGEILNNLRADKVKSKKLDNGVFILQKNTPKLIDKDNNEHVARIDEQELGETVFIHSEFDDEAFAMIGNEFCLNFLKDSKKVDFSYYYFSKDKKVIVYLYDMKKTFSGINDIIHLIEQWQNSIRTAYYCIGELPNYEISDVFIGVITEKNDVEDRKKEIEPIIEFKKNLERLPSFMKSQYSANNYDKIKKAKILDGFLEGKITILSNTYKYDIITFDNKQCHIYFKNGILKKEK